MNNINIYISIKTHNYILYIYISIYIYTNTHIMYIKEVRSVIEDLSSSPTPTPYYLYVILKILFRNL